jgi:hypothetical protein
VTISKWWLIGAGVCLLAFVVFGTVTWLQEHDARLKAESTQTAQQQVILSAQKSIDAAKADQAQTAAQLQTRIATLEAQKSQPVTPNQFVVDLAKLIPNLPQPATVVQPPPTTQVVDGKTEQVAGAPVVQIPAGDLQALQTYKLNCDETGAKLSACQLTGADLQTQLTGTQTQLKAMTTERDTWEATAKGGTLMQRLGHIGKCLAISGGGAGLGAAVDSKHPARGASIGGAVGVATCEMWRW